MTRSQALYFSLFFVGTFVFSFFFTRTVRYLADHFGLHDFPDKDRKIHQEPKPKLGGLAIFFSFVLAVVLLAVVGGTQEISGSRLAGLVVGGAILIIGGILDDKYDLSPPKQIIFSILAALVVVATGTHISFITSPWGGHIILDQYKVMGYPVFGGLLVFFWILGMIYTTKFLDGMDGLVTGISGIAGLVIFGLSLAPAVRQTTTALLSIIFAAACFGFLRHNFHPAKIFLGEGGSTFTGFMIGTLAVISGGKIATALLVLGIPVLDVAWVIVQRLWFRSSPFRGDRKHLHFRLLDIGLSQKQAVLLLYLISALFGGLGIFLQSLGKLVALGILSGIMLILAIVVAVVYRKKQWEQNQ